MFRNNIDSTKRSIKPLQREPEASYTSGLTGHVLLQNDKVQTIFRYSNNSEIFHPPIFISLQILPNQHFYTNVIVQ